MEYNLNILFSEEDIEDQYEDQYEQYMKEHYGEYLEDVFGNDDYDEEEYCVDIRQQHIEKKQVDITIVIPKILGFDQLIRNGKLKEMIKNSTIKNIFINENNINLYEDINNMSNEEFIKKINNVKLVATNDGLNYQKESKEMKNYNFYFDKEFPIDRKTFEKLKELYGDIDNFRVLIEGNTEPITLEEYEITINKIEKMVNTIKKYNLSNLEQIMFAYDLVRDRVYVSEEEEEKYAESRDLTKVLTGDKIVCLGFANIFNIVLNELGIKNEKIEVVSKNNQPGHARNLVQVKDSKYKIEGLYYFDPTFDCKKDKNDKNFLYNYRYFCQGKEKIDNLNENMNMKDKKYSEITFSNILDLLDKIESKKIDKNDVTLIKELNLINKEFFNDKLINDLDIFEIMMGSISSLDTEKLQHKVSNIFDSLYIPSIDKKTLLELMVNVRKVEYYENPDKYPFEIEAYSEYIDYANEVRKEMIFNILFGEESGYKEINKKEKEEEIEKEIERVKITKVLQKTLEKKIK